MGVLERENRLSSGFVVLIQLKEKDEQTGNRKNRKKKKKDLTPFTSRGKN